MPQRQYDKDLFTDSTMTFGEHLEELRGCLFKAIIGLALGFIIGLFLGNYVVDVIQTPLVRALATYYEDQAASAAKKKLQELRDKGEALPDEPAKIADFVKDNHLLPQQVYVAPDELLAQLRRYDPKRFGSLHSPGTDTGAAGSQVGGSGEPKSMNDLVPLFLWRPTADDSRTQATSLSVHETFVIWIKASLLVGIILASPYVFYQIWSFVGAGLYPHEKRYVHLFLPVSLGLFLLGASLAFFFVFEPILNFLLAFNKSMGINISPRISEWLSFVLVMPLGFGISFQLPLVMLFLERIGVFSVKSYLAQWRVAVLVIFFLAAILTPSPDPYSMLLMAIPLTLLYFGGVLLCKYMPRHRSPYDEA
jgi:sec-independent protein translocase protein TatC